MIFRAVSLKLKNVQPLKMVFAWNPLNSIRSNSDDNSDNYAVLLLNRSLDKLNSDENAETFLHKLWDKALLRVSVDGGTNYFKEKLSAFKMPDIICGDFDSIKPQILDYYKEQKSVKVIETPDQNETDFTKAVQETLKEISDKSIKLNCIVVLWSTGGRFDHIMGIINTLYKMINNTEIPLILYDVNNSLSWLLAPGEHTIESNAYSSWCALIPIGEPCTVKTQGLRWNLDDQKLAFGSLVSTSNEFDYKDFKQVKVKTDKPLLWSMDMSKIELTFKT